ncbi:hypothetical protein J0A68_13190 [Algoriphagus sp. H41]|uniref:Uncharacterized protein n=1 Tax=Algoriphagus oliviformis TaxID=2811231 RepID=A0ABS3C462_9BACT|nr:hypothetical protein [Algoriphagus oliviformis]MBN7811903.1 hypothetical protein [Algoriphagus oliviformis]
MLTKILLPHRYQKLGWVLLLPFALLLFANNYFDFNLAWLEFDVRKGNLFEESRENFTNELAMIGVFVSLFLIAFSRERQEDEYIQKLRLDSLLLACYAHTFILVVGTVLFYGFGFLEFMGYNMFTIQLLFIARFRWVLHRQKQSLLAF